MTKHKILFGVVLLIAVVSSGLNVVQVIKNITTLVIAVRRKTIQKKPKQLVKKFRKKPITKKM